MITESFFMEKMTELSKAFPSIATKSVVRLRRYRQALEDLPESAINSIVDTLMDNFSHTPLPKDFFEAAAAWKRANKVFDGQVIDIRPIECTDCYQTGFIFMRMEITEPEVLAFCHCAFGTQAHKVTAPLYNILRWEKGNFDRLFVKSPFPVGWFTPSENENARGLNDIMDWSKVRQWNQKIKDSHEYYLLRAQQPTGGLG